MNKVTLTGRVVRTPEISTSAGSDMKIARWSIACQRKVKNKEGGYDADFPNCVAFGKTAEFVEKYFDKGMMMGVVGRLQTGSYTAQDGTKRYTTDVIAEDVEFEESKASSDAARQNAANTSHKNVDNSFMNIPDAIDEELPFV